MEIRKGKRVRVICTEIRLKEVGVKQKHIKHILGKIGIVKEVRKIQDMDIMAYFIHFPYVMIEPINLEVMEGKNNNGDT